MNGEKGCFLDPIHVLIRQLEQAPSTELLFNHYRDEQAELDRPGAAPIRRSNLVEYLRYFTAHPPRFIVLGEAAGYQGCRFSGIPFTSEYVLEHHPFFKKQRPYRSSSSRERIWREPSASIVWELFGQLTARDVPMLWGTVPFHPHKPGALLSNRTPSRAESLEGIQYFLRLRALFPKATVIATGRIAEEMLRRHEIAHTAVRHPSHGGKAEFVKGVLKCVGG